MPPAAAAGTCLPGGSPGRGCAATQRGTALLALLSDTALHSTPAGCAEWTRLQVNLLSALSQAHVNNVRPPLLRHHLEGRQHRVVLRHAHQDLSGWGRAGLSWHGLRMLPAARSADAAAGGQGEGAAALLHSAQLPAAAAGPPRLIAFAQVVHAPAVRHNVQPCRPGAVRW